MVAKSGDKKLYTVRNLAKIAVAKSYIQDSEMSKMSYNQPTISSRNLQATNKALTTQKIARNNVVSARSGQRS